jgi:predicted MFS family arabinose efflux permease
LPSAAPEVAVRATYVLIFLAQLQFVAIVPLTPRFKHDLALSTVQIGAVIGSAGFATLAVSMPIGLLAERVSPRVVIIALAALLGLSAVGQGVAVDFWTLLASRVAFGAAFGGVWTVAPAWLAQTVPRHRVATALGAAETVAGLAALSGPAFAGLFADTVSVAAPFLVIGAAAGATSVWLLVTSKTLGNGGCRVEPAPRGTLQAVRRQPLVLAALAVTALLGLTNGAVNLLLPLRLSAHGLSAATIGIVFSIGSVIYTVASALSARAGARSATVAVAGGTSLVFGGVFVLALASSSLAALVAFALMRAPAWGVMATISLPLAALGAHDLGLPLGRLMGVLNVIWGSSNFVGPLLGGGVAQLAGYRWAFAVLMAVCLGVGSWLLVLSRGRGVVGLGSARPDP